MHSFVHALVDQLPFGRSAFGRRNYKIHCGSNYSFSMQGVGRLYDMISARHWGGLPIMNTISCVETHISFQLATA